MPANPNYRPDPKRAVYLQGDIDQNLTDRLTPQILSLRAVSREPITVYIDSLGGEVSCAQCLRSMLFALDQEGERSRILTVGISHVASAAADLLFYGDYSLAYPDCVVHCHGTRQPFDPLLNVTVLGASNVAHLLNAHDSYYARELAESCEERFYFRCLNIQPDLDLRGFLNATEGSLSPKAREVAGTARREVARYSRLIKRAGRSPNLELRWLKSLLDENFRRTSEIPRHLLFDVVEQFLALQFYRQMTGTQPVERPAYQNWLDSWLDGPDLTNLSGVADEELVAARQSGFERIHEFWLFFVALTRRLQHDENSLTAQDCLLLGLIDEVIGLADVPTRRLLAEYPRDSQ